MTAGQVRFISVMLEWFHYLFYEYNSVNSQSSKEKKSPFFTDAEQNLLCIPDMHLFINHYNIYSLICVYVYVPTYVLGF